MRLTWPILQSVYAPDPAEHWARAQGLGLDCPPDVFEQLFHEQHDSPDLQALLRFINWRLIEWQELELSGVALRQVAVPRSFQRAVDEARELTAEEGFSDERPEVMEHWQDARTWIRAPIVVTGDVLESGVGNVLVVGFTRLGNLLGALDRQDLPEANRHLIWIGQTGR